MAETPKIQIDSDWKAEAQKEKERLAKAEQEKTVKHGAAGAGGPLPPADFHALTGMLVQQAIMGLGVLADRKTGGVIVDLEGSRYAIDLLEVLEQKTKGNLTDEEAKELRQLLSELRTRFVQVASMVARQAAQGPAATAPGASDSLGASPAPHPAGPIITE